MADIIGDGSNNNLDGTADDDLIIGGGGSDTLDGLAGNDTIIGDTSETLVPKVTLTVNSQAGSENGDIIVSIYDADGTFVETRTIVEDYDANVGNSFSFLLEPGQTFAVAATSQSNDGNGTDTHWSTEGDEVITNEIADGVVQACVEDIQGPGSDNDFNDVIFTTTIEGDAAMRTADGLIEGAGDGVLLGDGATGGPDLITGGAGDDSIEGGVGNDTIYGDDAGTAGTFAGPRESFNWDLVSGSQADSTVTQDTGDVEVIYTRITDTGSHRSNIDNDTDLAVDGIDGGSETVDDDSALTSETRGDGNTGGFRWAFSAPVGNVDFNINDLDGDGVVTVRAYDEDGNEVDVVLTGGSNIDVDGNTATGSTPYLDPDNDAINVQVEIAGPVSRIELVHTQDGSDNSGIWVTDLHYDTGFVPSNDGDGDDTIDGGADNDLIFGEGGEDSLIGGTGNDTIDGGLGNDTIIAGAGNDSAEGGEGQDLIVGGGDNDVLSGGDDEDTFFITFDDVTSGVLNTTVHGGAGGVDFDTLDISGLLNDGWEITNAVLNPDSDGNGFDGQVQLYNSDTGEYANINFTNIEASVTGPDIVLIPCFTPGTLIATATGERRVEELQPGDRVITRDNGLQEIRWVGRRDMSGAELAAAPHLRPVLIREGALGKGLPERDMLVSPQHRVLITGERPQLFFEESEVLVAAKHLTGMDGVDVVDVSSTTYIHVMFDHHEVILSDGAWTESFQPGDMTLGSMDTAQRSEILELFPELGTQDGVNSYAAARRALRKHEARVLFQ